MRCTWPFHFILFHLMILTVFGEETNYVLVSFYSIFSSLLLRHPFSNILIRRWPGSVGQ
jgi:hypothetical protein